MGEISLPSLHESVYVLCITLLMDTLCVSVYGCDSRRLQGRERKEKFGDTSLEWEGRASVFGVEAEVGMCRDYFMNNPD